MIRPIMDLFQCRFNGFSFILDEFKQVRSFRYQTRIGISRQCSTYISNTLKKYPTSLHDFYKCIHGILHSYLYEGEQKNRLYEEIKRGRRKGKKGEMMYNWDNKKWVQFLNSCSQTNTLPILYQHGCQSQHC